MTPESDIGFQNDDTAAVHPQTKEAAYLASRNKVMDLFFSNVHKFWQLA